MMEKQILSLKPAPRLEQVGDEHSERVQDRKHRSQGCDDSALRCESRPDGIFGKDRHVFVHAKRWRAISGAPLSTGQPVRVTSMDGLVLNVEPDFTDKS